jgi:hypothetical protein
MNQVNQMDYDMVDKNLVLFDVFVVFYFVDEVNEFDIFDIVYVVKIPFI